MIPTEAQKRLVIVGATGMVGGYALRYALAHPAVQLGTTIGRRKIGVLHSKLNAMSTPANFNGAQPIIDPCERAFILSP